VKAVEAFVLLAVLALIVVLLLRAGVRRWRDSRAPWELDEHSDGERVCIYASRPGEDRLLIGAAPFKAQDFDCQLYEIRAEGRAKVYALNQASTP
jgi:hypothetical protein